MIDCKAIGMIQIGTPKFHPHVSFFRIEPLFGRLDDDGGLAPSCQRGAEASEKGLRA